MLTKFSFGNILYWWVLYQNDQIWFWSEIRLYKYTGHKIKCSLNGAHSETDSKFSHRIDRNKIVDRSNHSTWDINIEVSFSLHHICNLRHKQHCLLVWVTDRLFCYHSVLLVHKKYCRSFYDLIGNHQLIILKDRHCTKTHTWFNLRKGATNFALFQQCFLNTWKVQKRCLLYASRALLLYIPSKLTSSLFPE